MFKPRKKKEDGLQAKPTIISLADVALCLLVIVLSTGGAVRQFIEVSLPEAENTASRDINLAVNVTVTSDGKYYFVDDRTAIAAKNLWTALKEIKGDSVWTLAVVRADRATGWEHVGLLAQCLESLGVDEISYQMKEGSD
jgi:biopolymer transport protein ExbD